MIRTMPYRALALGLAALMAGIVVGLEVAAFAWLSDRSDGMSAGGVLSWGLLAAALAAPAFLIGLSFPGIPVWMWLHKTGRRSYLVAALAAGIGASIAGAVLTAPAAGWWSLVSIAWLALPGAVGGLALRWIAYAPIKPLPPPAPPS